MINNFIVFPTIQKETNKVKQKSPANAGLSETINAYHPTISCAVYHRNEDMFNIPLLLASMYSKCKLYMRHFPYVPAWDTNIYIKYGE